MSGTNPFVIGPGHCCTNRRGLPLRLQVRAAVAANDRAGRQPVKACRSGVGGAGFQHPVTPSERSECRHPLSAQRRCLAPVDRQHRDKICGRRGMVCQATRSFQASAVPQTPSGHRCRYARCELSSGCPFGADRGDWCGKPVTTFPHHALAVWSIWPEDTK